MRAAGLLVMAVVSIGAVVHTTNTALVVASPPQALDYANPGSAGPDDIVSVRGIWVHRSLASSMTSMMNDAYDAGIPLAGWGWRDHNRQHELRRINGCPNDGSWTHFEGEDPSRWASSRSCRIPTARPGSSMHESGLAIDFTCAGLRFAGSRCWSWFVAGVRTADGRITRRANTYGLYNLPSEPWHWSTNGR